ncbi:MAG: 4-(cytidine 5'-diphospho)-2-C-methyl-D-erythritol kinase [Sphaerochaeta sp.]
METMLERSAYAKVNLHLAVGQPFQDGYHPIRSLFALVNLCDEISIVVLDRGSFSVTVSGLEALSLQGEDTMSKASRLWCERSNIPLSLHITCKKHIPSQAGLGGGSSDAAAVLLLLQEYAKEDALDDHALGEIALAVGSDVPFFLSSHPCALVSGRGEHIVPVSTRALYIALIMPTSIAISTSSAYGMLDALRNGGEVDLGPSDAKIVEVFKNSPAVWNSLLYNDFQQCVAEYAIYADLATICNTFPGFSGLSGSGACWFFVSDEHAAVSALVALVQRQYGLHVTCYKTGLVVDELR